MPTARASAVDRDRASCPQLPDRKRELEIRHKQTGEILASIPEPTLHGARLAGADLRYADLRHACIRDADFTGAVLAGADLRGAMISGCNFREAKLIGVCLSGASITGGSLAQARVSRSDLRLATLRRIYMRGCDLRHSDLRGARLEAVDLEDAALNHAVLRRAIFLGANLHGANLTNAAFCDTALHCCGNLHEARGLHGVSHSGPSWLDLQTLRRSGAGLPETFLDGLGITRREAEVLRTLADGANPSEGAYVAAAPAHEALSWNVVCDLRARNFAAWPQAVDGAGSEVQRRLRPSPRKGGRLVLICSEALFRCEETAEIVTAAVEFERRARIQTLFPVSVDGFLQSGEILALADEAVEQGAWRLDWVRYLRSLFVADWSRWNEPQSYQVAMELLARDLHNPAKR